MLDFNLWTFNSRVFPGIDHVPVRKGDRVQVRIANLSMTNHPIHMHGHHFSVTCTDGGWVPESARWPETTIDLPVGAIRAYDFLADVPGDWALHCHKSHHTMNAMRHDVRTYIGVNLKEVRASFGAVTGKTRLAESWGDRGNVAGIANPGRASILPDKPRGGRVHVKVRRQRGSPAEQ
jgi:manganese oxidase